MWRALSHFQLKNYAQALADLAKAGDLKHGDSSFLGLIPPELLATCPNAGFQKGILELADREIRWAQQKADSLAQEAAYRYRALIHAAFGNEKEALADCAKGAQFAITFSREASKNQTGDLNRLAWIWSTVADPRWRQPAAAVRLAQRAVEFEPKVASYWTTLGVAYYRNGQPQKAIQALTRAVELGKGDSPIEFFFLALAHQQMKNTPQARQWYGKAMAGMDQKNEEVRRFQVEAAQVLGLPEVLPLPKEEKPR
jgi:tetratricopeptide (TPR) repeat protein